MDRVLSTRIDEAVVERISGLARHLHLSKKSVIEQAVVLFASKVEAEGRKDIFDQTFGSWKRRETAGQTVKLARGAFRKSMERHVL